ncbi:hypothetical protein HMPREF0841_0360 [Streptococcus pyogenes ATCC 10782]|nr:hypothetical protein HMPREF0841_0360 [Streptococcus pyogenes ATCC 10782]
MEFHAFIFKPEVSKIPSGVNTRLTPLFYHSKKHLFWLTLYVKIGNRMSNQQSYACFLSIKLELSTF